MDNTERFAMILGVVAGIVITLYGVDQMRSDSSDITWMVLGLAILFFSVFHLLRK